MTDETRKAVVEIDACIRRHLWFDFQVFAYQGDELVISGGTDLLYGHELEIHFHKVFFVSAYFDDWHSDTANPVFTVPEASEAFQLNVQFEIEQGYNLFIFKTEGRKNNVLVAAENISYNTDSVLYYYRENLEPGMRIADFVARPN